MLRDPVVGSVVEFSRTATTAVVLVAAVIGAVVEGAAVVVVGTT